MTKKKVMLFVLIICVFMVGLRGEQKPSDNINIPESKVSVDKMNRLAESSLSNNFKKALEYGKKALNMSEKLSYKKGKVTALKNIGLAYFYLSNYKESMTIFKRMLIVLGKTNGIDKADTFRHIGTIDLAFGNYKKSLSSFLFATNIYLKLGEEKGLLKTLNSIGDIFLKLGIYEKAHKYYFDAILVAKKLNDRRSIALIYNNIGNGYEQLIQYDKALVYYLNAYEIKKEMNNQFDMANSLQNIGWVYFKLGKLDMAVLFTEQSLDIKNKIKDKVGISEVFNNLGEIYYKNNNNKKALEYFNDSLKLRTKLGKKRSIAYTKNNLAILYIKLKEYKKAEKYINEGLKLSISIKALDLEKEFYYSYYKFYSIKKNYRKGLKYLELYHNTKVNIDHQSSRSRIMEIESNHNFDEKVRGLHISNVDLNEHKSVKIFLFITIILIFVIFMLLYIRYRFGIKIQKEIKEKDRSHKKALKEIELMSRKDHLTSLSNRRDIIQRIQTEKDRLRRKDNVFSIVMVDIDNFKNVNDSYGNNTGDYVLTVFSDVLKENIRKQDVAARWGGEEFLLLLPETTIEGANKIAEKIRDIVQNKVFEYKNNYIKITITLGVGKVDDFSLNINDIINRVDEAVTKGKKAGKNQVVSI